MILVNSPKQYCGVSSDTKPTGALAGSQFRETDTGDVYMSNGTAWVKTPRDWEEL